MGVLRGTSGDVISPGGFILKKLVLAFIAVAAASGSALAADMTAPRAYTKAPGVPAASTYDWSGFYVGGTAGGAFGSFDPSTSTTFLGNNFYFSQVSVPPVNAAGAQSIKPGGFTGGAEIGYNWQVRNFVVGLEGDIEYLGLAGNASTTAPYAPPFAASAFTVTSNASTTWLATARGRVGIAANDWLFFATGGAAFTNLKANFGFSDNCFSSGACGPPPNASEATSISSMKAGFAVGGGVEKAIGQNWTVKAEYMYVGFGTITGTGILTGGGQTQPMTHSYDLKANIIRLGINYKFGGPVVARY